MTPTLPRPATPAPSPPVPWAWGWCKRLGLGIGRDSDPRRAWGTSRSFYRRSKRTPNGWAPVLCFVRKTTPGWVPRLPLRSWPRSPQSMAQARTNGWQRSRHSAHLGLQQDVVLGRREAEKIAFGNSDHALTDTEGGASRCNEIELGLDVEVTRTPPPVDWRILPDEGARLSPGRKKGLMDRSPDGCHVSFVQL